MWTRINSVDLPEPTYHTVSFNSNGGSDVASQQVLDQGNASEPSVPTREGHTFEGWFADPSLTQSFDFATAIDADKTLYAKWHKI
ncbi:InlB B-repeat-containing protein, partial [Erysipelothrix aquatica]